MVKTSLEKIVDEIMEYKNLVIECENEENELEVQHLADLLSLKLQTIMIIVESAQHEAVIKALKGMIKE